MKCRDCGHHETTVLETRNLMGGTVIRRRRGCAHCGGSFATYEIDGGIWGTVKKWAVGDRTKTLEKRHALRRRNEEIVAMIKAGRQHKEIGEHFGLATSTICYTAKKAGLPGRRGPKRTKKVANPWGGLL